LLPITFPQVKHLTGIIIVCCRFYLISRLLDDGRFHFVLAVSWTLLWSYEALMWVEQAELYNRVVGSYHHSSSSFHAWLIFSWLFVEVVDHTASRWLFVSSGSRSDLQHVACQPTKIRQSIFTFLLKVS